MEHLRELLTDLEEDINTESSLRELVNDVKFSLDDEKEKGKTKDTEQPIENLKKYIENVVKENVNTPNIVPESEPVFTDPPETNCEPESNPVPETCEPED